MVGKIIIGLGSLASRYRSSWLGQRIVKTIRILYFKSENDNYDLKTNGEGRVIQILRKFDCRIFFDVGANHGEWSREVKNNFPDGSIFAFEASPVTFVKLEQNLKNIPGITALNLGLFDKEGVLDFFQNPDDGLSSLIQTETNSTATRISVALTTIDKYVTDNKIANIDFLKIDAEGADFAILQGARETLKRGIIDVIQFEYGFVSVDTGNLLRHHYQFLQEYGYLLGKIYPASVDFSPYNRGMENFIGPNILAVKKEKADLIEALR